jgi:2-keto-3-deoxy-L-rhamnonate aldolase RhmA
MNYTSIKQQLRSNARLNGCWIETFSPICAEIVAISGYDTAMIDLEHGPGTCLDAIPLMQAVHGRGCTPLIRSTSSNPAAIKRVLDIGPAGIMVPNIRTLTEAEQTVASCRYGPQGHRGAAPGIIRATGYGGDVSGYLEWMQNDFLIIGQVESASAVDQIEDIARVDGLDMIFIGPSDLSASLGALGDYGRPEFIEAMETVEKATQAAGKWLGTIPFSGWDARRLFDSGYGLVISGTDTLLLRRAAEADVGEMQRSART